MKIPRNNFKIGSFYTNEQLMKYFNKLQVYYIRELPYSNSPTLCEFAYNKLLDNKQIEPSTDIECVYYPGKYEFGGKIVDIQYYFDSEDTITFELNGTKYSTSYKSLVN